MKRTPPRADVVIVGAGIMGCACAWKLGSSGARVVVLEKSVPGAEASSAAAGILGAQVEAHGPGPLVDLCLASRDAYGAFASALVRETRIDVGYRETGVLRVGLDARGSERIRRETAWQRRAGHTVELVRSARRLEPALSEKAGGVLFPNDACVDPPRLLRALRIAGERTGAVFRSGAQVRSIVVRRGRAVGVELDAGEIVRAENVVVAAGSWTDSVLGTEVARGAVVPARGQIVELDLPAPPIARVVVGPGAYLVPRDDGRVLVGSTLEFVGYRREVTARAVRDLLAAAIDLAPVLAEASLKGAWSSFRPYTKDELPLLGRAKTRGLILATGHYRNGILLAPITAEIVTALVLGRSTGVDLRPFDVARARCR